MSLVGEKGATSWQARWGNKVKLVKNANKLVNTAEVSQWRAEAADKERVKTKSNVKAWQATAVEREHAKAAADQAAGRGGRGRGRLLTPLLPHSMMGAGSTSGHLAAS